MGEEQKGGRVKMTSLKSSSGMVWWEWLVLIAIVAVLAAIAIPNFLQYGARSKQTEARTNLKYILYLQQEYFKKHGHYGNSFEEIYFTTPENYGWRHCRFGMGDSRLGVDRREEELARLLKELAKPDGFVAISVGNNDSDDTLDVWMVDETGKLMNLVDDVRE
jgi:type II secretory pathway pseudopilin PulG